jgi:hypothetical protein
MNSLIQGTATIPEPRLAVSMKRSGNMHPGADNPTLTRRESLLTIWAALAGHRRAPRGLPGPGSRASAGRGLSPIASGASRGVAIFVSR